MTSLQQLVAKISIDSSGIPGELQAASQAMQSGLSVAAQQAQLRVDSLSERLGFQKQQLASLGAELAAARAKYGDDTVQVDRLQLSFDKLSASIGQSERQLQISKQRLDDVGNSTNIAGQYAGAFGSSIAAMVGPAAVATAGIGALVSVGNSFKDAFTWDAQLKQTTDSINVQLKGVRDAQQVWSQASDYATKYKLTQEQVNTAIAASIPVTRNSTASMQEILGVFDLLRAKKPEKTFEDAARALAELQSGQTVTIEKMFDVPLVTANKWKKEIQDGGDAVDVVTKGLADLGVNMDAVAVGTRGAVGAMKDLAIAEENLRKAQAEWARGPGLNFLNAETIAIKELTNTLGNGLGVAQAFSNIWAGYQGNIVAVAAFNAELLKTGSIEDAVKVAAAARGEVYRQASDKQTIGILQSADAEDRRTAALQKSIAVQSDYVDLTGKTADQIQALRDKLDSTGQAAADAYAKIGTDQQAYLDASARAQQAHDQKLQSIDADAAQRRQQIAADSAERRQNIESDFTTRAEQAARDSGDRRFKLERDNQNAITQAQQDAAARKLQITQEADRRVSDAQADSTRKIADLEKEIQQKRVADTTSLDQQLADRRSQIADSYADQVAQNAQRETDIQQAALERQAERAQASADRIADIQAQAQQRAQDQAEDRAQDAQDKIEDRQQAAEDRAQAHADRLAELAQKAQETQSGNVVTLTGDRSSVDIPGGAGATQAQIDAENRRYAEQEQRAQQAQQREDERQARTQSRQDRAAQEALQRQQEAAQRQAEQQAASDAKQQQQQEQALQRQEAAQQAAYEKQLAQAEQQAARQRDVLAKSIADAVAAVQEKIADEREAETRREADIRGAAERSRADEDTRLAADLQKRRGALAIQESDLRDALQKQIEQARQAHDAALEQLNTAQQKQLQQVRTQAAQRRADEQQSYARQEADRTAAYEKQQEQDKQAFGRQLEAYTRAQVAIGDITKSKGEERIKYLEGLYNRQAELARTSFTTAFGGQYGSDATIAGQRQEQLANIKDAGLIAGGTTINGGITIQVTSTSADPAAVAREVRSEFIRGIGQNGGNVNAYFTNQ